MPTKVVKGVEKTKYYLKEITDDILGMSQEVVSYATTIKHLQQ